MKTRRQIALPVRPLRRGFAPLWRTLADSLAWEIDIGRLTAGSRLPSTRTLARELGVSRNTAAEAYDDLGSRGYLQSRVGDGAYVAASVDRPRSMLSDRSTITGLTADGIALRLIR